MPKSSIAEKLDVSPDTIRKWKDEIIPDGSGLPAKVRYDSMDRVMLEKDFPRLEAVAKMYLVERIIEMAPHEKDLGKVSGALRDLANLASKSKETEPEKTASAWGEFVDKAIKEVIKKKGVVNVIQNQQINNGIPEDQD